MLKLFLTAVLLVIAAFIVLYSKKMLKWYLERQEKTQGFIYRLIGRRVKRFNTQMERASIAKQKSILARVNNYFKEMIINLDMEKDDVTPAGLLAFIGLVALSVTLIFTFWSKEITLSIPMFASVFYLEIVLFRFIGLTQFEKKEARIMDVEDLIAMDVKGGVFNAIVRYQKSFHPSVRPYFDEFLDNIQRRNYSFKQSMNILNHRLGYTFNDFAKKAIQYEEKADADMVEIFSSVIEINRQRRSLRHRNNVKFNELRLAMILSLVIIMGYALFAMLTDDFVNHFFTQVFFGKLLLIIDVLAVAGAMSYIAAIKSKFL